VALDVQRFDSSFAEGATLDAAWTVTPAKGPSRSGRTFAREAAPSRDHAGIAAAHRRALEKLAREIAAAIKN
ncbi:MAG TPA: ABC-type transport auxiliary lipoprotein family protein, partial [Usitatibacter sp.]|nr:ABC-type transport auxiliary lipoprotein family protein [Usitatibacter sp.]